MRVYKFFGGIVWFIIRINCCNVNSIYRLWEDDDRIYRKLMVWKKMFLVDTPRTTTETVATYVFKEKIDLCLSSVWPKIKMAIGTIHYYQNQFSRFHEKITSSEQRAIYPWQLIINAAMKEIFRLGFSQEIINWICTNVLEEKSRIMH